jgi:hypothetical protein
LLDRLRAGQRGTRDQIRNRIARTLKAEFGRKVPFLVVLETDGDGRLHTHGIVGLAASDLDRAAVALCKAGGKWTSALPQRQVKLDPIYNPVGWWRYITEDLGAVPEEQRRLWIGWSQPLKATAKTFYESVRTWWIQNADDLSTRHSLNFFMSGEGFLEGLFQ